MLYYFFFLEFHFMVIKTLSFSPCVKTSKTTHTQNSHANNAFGEWVKMKNGHILSFT